MILFVVGVARRVHTPYMLIPCVGDGFFSAVKIPELSAFGIPIAVPYPLVVEYNCQPDSQLVRIRQRLNQETKAVDRRSCSGISLGWRFFPSDLYHLVLCLRYWERSKSSISGREV